MEDAALVAKMYLCNVDRSTAPDGTVYNETIKLAAVYSQSSEDPNRKWAKSTPSGHLQLSIDNPAAHGAVKPGYYKVLLVPCGKDD